MKKSIVLFLLFTLTLTSFSQEKTNETNKKNELKLDVFDLAFFSALDVGYENLFRDEMSFGLSMFINFKSSETYYEKFALTPFYRFYFFNNQQKGGKGNYVEVFSKFASGNNLDLEYLNNSKLDDSYFDVNLGIAVGKKWISNTGFVLEISFGGGRNLGFSEASPEYAFRGGVSFGYRF
ncbi:MAG: DUF3575 domain-containing protein [Polaribacter sp.]|uniref:DUF3575 domain-containing protein n=1 Tax=Polaribacter sp. TaxID=1920175 RepID=UPI003BB09BA4